MLGKPVRVQRVDLEDHPGKPLPPGSPMPELVLTISGMIRPAVAGKLPDGVEPTGTVGESVFDIRGYFVADSSNPLVVGTVTAVKNDPGKQPNGTHGPFVLYAAGA